MRKILPILLIFFSAIAMAQIKYEPGYYINPMNQKITGFIKNLDWNQNPSTIEFKENLDSDVQIKTIHDMKEFGIDQKSKYIKATIKMDRSSEEMSNLSHQKNPEFKTETVFLETMVEGKSTLFSYKEPQFTRFFFQNEGGEITQLIYKRYFVDVNKIATNDQFKNQLRANVNCNFKNDQFLRLNYSRSSLVNHFEKYNECNNSTGSNYVVSKTKSDFNLYIKPGVSFTNLDVVNTALNNSYIDFGSKTIFKIGVEFEYLLPFHKNKWGLFVSPTYKAYKAEGMNEIRQHGSTIEYNSIELPLGVRHYFLLSSSSRIFTHGAILWDLNVGGDFKFEHHVDTMDIKSGNNFMFGIGYSFNSKFSVEFNVYTKRKILSDYYNWNSNYSNMGISVGYNFL
ncbi:tRNA modification GTPase [Moheibacter stercoris]|uniref:Outer membrane protein beta-barrel domain-containing protein n=1 Tax=Moheibacter stercoris TaxID=1628251 RepID=A0ABV2LXU4_9FLAO